MENIKSKLFTMTKMQYALDESIYQGHDAEFDKEKTYLAMLDEIGELNHELKSTWCWWKKTQKAVNREKMVEELVDVWHFALSIYNHDPSVPTLKQELEAYEIMIKNPRSYSKLVKILLGGRKIFILACMLELTYALDVDFEEVYQAYITKNKVNYERLNNGY